ncbi:hypothetical protein AVEN_249613-1 [Araneus ventricosus]|uniref:Uncharacterized protein n=1 Tax=Araneus ventricosus TaxID=182803 RepID=A0A4Y2UWS1_ARAVE|nr:hypothetical protein AVEN_249613-1 [Araneus ventricosus]
MPSRSDSLRSFIKHPIAKCFHSVDFTEAQLKQKFPTRTSIRHDSAEKKSSATASTGVRQTSEIIPALAAASEWLSQSSIRQCLKERTNGSPGKGSRGARDMRCARSPAPYKVSKVFPVRGERCTGSVCFPSRWTRKPCGLQSRSLSKTIPFFWKRPDFSNFNSQHELPGSGAA